MGLGAGGIAEASRLCRLLLLSAYRAELLLIVQGAGAVLVVAGCNTGVVLNGDGVGGWRDCRSFFGSAGYLVVVGRAGCLCWLYNGVKQLLCSDIFFSAISKA
jgi:hypothetical protein